LSSANGLAIERAADDLRLNSDGDIVRIARPGGLKISDAYARFDRKVEAAGLPKPAAMPALIPFAEWSKIEPNHFHDRYEQLLAAASDETQAEAQQDKTSGVQNRLALARFLVGSELSFEAIGVLDALGKSHEELLSNAEFRGLRGAAKVLAGRYKEAQTDLSSPVLSEEPSAALWRSYAAAQLSQWQDVRAEFARGLRAFDLTDPAWRAKFARAEAQAALELGDYISAKARIEQALSLNDDPVEQLQARLIQARLIEAQGAPDKALKLYEAVARAPQDQISAPALVRAVNIRLAQGKLTQDKAIETYESLRFRWRGDAVELQVIRALGQLHLDHGRYREALEVLRAAGKRLPDLPEALQLQADLAAAFRVLFLEGQADGLQPIQALAMFYDFRELTPVGAEGDEMVRKLAQRLVNVDLLDRAADLLKYQAENRLDGVPRASVAADQALIELMARKPEAALDALNSSRTTLLPTALAHQRRLLEARAWLQMNNPDHAAELLDGDRSPEAQALQAEVAWKRKDWAGAGRLYEVGLGRRFEDAAAPLTVDEEQRLLRAAAAYSLAADDGALARLRTRYGAFVDRARSPDALRVALAGADDQLNMGDVVKAVSDDEAFAGWVQKMKTRLRDQPLVKTSNPAPTPVPAPAKVAEAVGATAAG
ncbi:MAG: tetratricopeptide repeat protein, partial [Caulobacteraceae bacterium]